MNGELTFFIQLIDVQGNETFAEMKLILLPSFVSNPTAFEVTLGQTATKFLPEIQGSYELS